MQRKMQKGKSVIKYLFICLIIVSCKTANIQKVKSDIYVNKVYRSKSGYTGMNIKAYDYEYKNELNAGVIVNEIYFDLSFNDKNELKPLYVKVLPNKKINIDVFFPSREVVKMRDFYLKKGDSMVIKAYLKEDNSSVY